ncbi:MAG TPA: 50S ribosomal protein L29 [Candidatus Azoamicus sp. OHIO1]
MKVKDIRNKGINELKTDVISLYKGRLKLRLEKTSGAEFKKNHLFKALNKNIARVLTVIKELEGS